MRGHVCRPKVGPQSDTRLTTRLRGSRGSLPPFRCGLEPQKNDTSYDLTPEGVFFVALSTVRLNIWILCQQAQVETHFSTVFPANKSALKSNAGALALRKTNSGFCHCRNASQIKMYFLYRSMAFGEEGRRDTDAFSKPAHSQDSKSRCQAAFSAYSSLGDKTIHRSSSVKVRPVGRLAGSRAIAPQSPGLDGGRAADYSFGTRGNTLCNGGMHSTDGGGLGGSPNKWNFAVKIPYLLGQRRCPRRCVSYKKPAVLDMSE